MANKVTQLVNENNDNLYPLAGGMAADSITTQMLKDGAVTSDKIDYTTYTLNTPVRVGTWVDGQALYRITRHITVTSPQTEATFSVGDSASTGVVWFEGRFNRPNNATTPLNFYHITSPTLCAFCFAANTTQINYYSPREATSLDVNIYYTRS